MEKIYWFLAALGAIHFLLYWVAGVLSISTIWVRKVFKYSAIVFVLAGWMGTIASGSNLFSLPFYPVLFLCAIGYALVVSGILFCCRRKTKA